MLPNSTKGGEFSYGVHVDLYNEMLGWGRVIGVGLTLGRLQAHINLQVKN